MLIYITVAPTGGSLWWARGICDMNDAVKGAMKAEGQARLEPPINPGCAFLDLCTCAARCGMHMVRWDGQPTGGSKRHRDGTSSCFAACMLLCSWLLYCTYRICPCFLLVAMPLHCPALPLYPRRSNY